MIEMKASTSTRVWQHWRLLIGRGCWSGMQEVRTISIHGGNGPDRHVHFGPGPSLPWSLPPDK